MKITQDAENALEMGMARESEEFRREAGSPYKKV